MSVIVRHPETGQITLYCKGADTILFERLHPHCKELMETTKKHLAVSSNEGHGPPSHFIIPVSVGIC